MSKVVASYGTGYMLTSIVESGDGDYLWTRRPGPARTTLMRTPPPAVLAAVLAVPQGRVGLTIPERREDGGVTYRTGQSRPIASMFLGVGQAFDLEMVAADTLTATGQTLARLHAQPLPQVGLPSPEGPQRLLSWLRGGHGPGPAADLHRRAVEILGRSRLATAETWCAPLPKDRHVLLHGAPGHGILLPVTPGREGALLIGEDISAGPPEFDVGWLIGELVEFRDAGRKLGHGPLRDVDYDALIGRLLHGYATPLDLTEVGRVAALRFLTHTHDFAAYMAWHEILVGYLNVLAEVIDAADGGQLLISSQGKVSYG
ncbi:hypothetical protein Aple_079530 [Acrocarpospora pleiomorpha]|uniref:Aminoglycoside phosphotransferase domain-containing protein n=1 Tax=Acrocarpospora pleiomorpha TaxID=90975 RepID=A0A5M3XV16_9ACTN|nr:hypothetical protein [Acrocarpospora pleiomorpha]GES25054.1 hypothetical protein Aple_079530 [Acrocarpospora pleiomorpha]